MSWNIKDLARSPVVWTLVAAALVAVAAWRVWPGNADDISRMAARKDVQELAKAAAGGDEVSACRAVRALGQMPSGESAQALLARAKDPRPAVRAHVPLALARAAGRKQSATFAEMLRDGDEQVRAAAAKAIGLAWDCDHVPDLVAAIDDPAPMVSQEACKSLSRICGIEPGHDTTDPAERRRRQAMYYQSFWKVSGPTITRYHHEHRGK